VGDPLKDTSGPSINILIKLMAITSLIFAQAFLTKGGILLPYLDHLSMPDVVDEFVKDVESEFSSSNSTTTSP
jgi:hypothetical protein